MLIFAADLAVPAGGAVVEDFAVAAEGERIAATGSPAELTSRFPDAEVRHYGGAVMLPGLINAHCHLELEFCRGGVEYDGDFVEWLQSIRELKLEWEGEEISVRQGIGELVRSGVTAVCDHYTMEQEVAWEEVDESGLDYYGFRELFQFDNHTPSLDSLGLEPRYSYAAHAPYTASREIAELAKSWSRDRSRAFSTHLSEMDQEVSFIRDGDADGIERLLKAAGVWEEGFSGYGCSPVRFFSEIGVLDATTLAVHCNYVSPDDVQLLARSGATVVFCPNSFRYFGHEDHPLERFLAAGVNVALGTDSVASNRGLDMLDELTTAREMFPDVPGATWLGMLTANGHKPLGSPASGRIEQGSTQGIAVFPYTGASEPGAIVAHLADDQPDALLTARGERILHER